MKDSKTNLDGIEKINIRAGFRHLHSGEVECGIAYYRSQIDFDVYGQSRWAPCSKLLNHDGRCGYADNSAY